MTPKSHIIKQGICTAISISNFLVILLTQAIEDYLLAVSYGTVGDVMRDLPADSDVPWHRIVGKDKKYGVVKKRPGPRGDEDQIRLLEEDGVVFLSSGKIDLELYQYAWEETNSAAGTDSKSVPKDTIDNEQD